MCLSELPLPSANRVLSHRLDLRENTRGVTYALPCRTVVCDTDLQLSQQMNVFRLQRIEFFVDLLCQGKSLTQIEADGRFGRGGRDVELVCSLCFRQPHDFLRQPRCDAVPPGVLTHKERH